MTNTWHIRPFPGILTLEQRCWSDECKWGTLEVVHCCTCKCQENILKLVLPHLWLMETASLLYSLHLIFSLYKYHLNIAGLFNYRKLSSFCVLFGFVFPLPGLLHKVNHPLLFDILAHTCFCQAPFILSFRETLFNTKCIFLITGFLYDHLQLVATLNVLQK